MTIRDSAPADRPRPTAVTSRRGFRWAALCYAAFSTGDCLTTGYALAHGGRERNPLAAALYANGGLIALAALKLGVVVLILVVLSRLPHRAALGVATVFAAVAALVVVANLSVFGDLR